MPLASIITNNNVTVAFAGGFTKTVRSDSSMFKRVLDLIKTKATDAVLAAAMDLASAIKRHASGKFEVTDGGVVSIDGEALPNSLSVRIVKFADEGFDFEPLLKFWNNVKKNPDQRAKTDLYAFLEHNGIPITADGCFIGYRAVKNDWFDKRTGTMLNTVGTVLKMNRADCDADPNQTCSRGLHVAAYNYARHSYGSGDDRLLEVKVNPEHVVAIPTDYNGEKMRVCEFTVMAENVDGIVNRTVYDPQNVQTLQVTDDGWDDQDDESGATVVAAGPVVNLGHDGWQTQKRLKNGRFGSKRK